MAYQFRLETVLSYRKSLEEQTQLKLSREHSILQGHMVRLEEIVTEKNDIVASLNNLLRSEVLASMYAFYQDSIAMKELQIEHQKTLIASQQKVVETFRNELIEKIKDRKVMERYRERDYRKYLDEQSKKEQKILDELAVLRHGKNVH